MLKRVFIASLLVILVSFYLFPVSFVFLPRSLNSKILLAGFGVFAFMYDSVMTRSITIPRYFLYSALFAIVFSLWCFYSINANATEDFTYVRYWISFFTWVLGAYAICFLFTHFTGSVSLSKVTYYLATVCVVQCFLAEAISLNPLFQYYVDRVFIQGQEFYKEINRMYGIGAALDPAGVRFSVVLVLMAHQMSSTGKVMESTFWSLFYFLSYIIIVIIGSMIARTTWVGASLGLVYMIVSYLRLDRGYLSGKQQQFWLLFFGMTLLTILISTVLYRVSPDFRSNLRFGFEGFFNWAESGVFRTGSTDKLNGNMWVWPQDSRTWLIGTGYFDNWAFGTDIGYCRFILYCGVVGMGIFSLLFIFSGISLMSKFPNFTIMGLFCIALVFIVWLKVSTDIFFLFSLLHWLPNEKVIE